MAAEEGEGAIAVAAEKAAEGSKMIVLLSSDGVEFELSEEAAKLSKTIDHMIEDDCASGTIPLPNVAAKALSMAIEYCNKHVKVAPAANNNSNPSSGAAVSSSSSNPATAATEDELKKWDEDFVNIEQGPLFNLILAANYLEIKGLLDITCQKVADMIKGKTPEQIRETFNIVNDFTAEEEDEIRRENAWAFED